MIYDEEVLNKLGDEFFNLWKECKSRIEKIEILLNELIKS